MAGYKGWSGGDDVDWDEVDSGSPTPLDRGIYGAVVTKAECKETKNGKPCIELNLDVTDKYDSDDDVSSRKLFDTFTMTKDALFKTKQFCEAADMEPPASTRYGDVSEFAEELIDTEVWVLLGQRTFEGKSRNRIEFYIHDDDVEEVHERESGDPSGGGRKGRGRTRKAKGDDDSDKADKPKGGRRRKKKASSKSNGKAETKSDEDDGGTEDIEDKDESQDEEKPRRARRRRRRSQAEQG